ncbi:MAG: prolyl oligopeptidase family serine peptidase [Ignavibacteriales bacterium]|nr:prolyl oligopeptidase family serine peptidase [Ignavibacteriales bacterium]
MKKFFISILTLLFTTNLIGQNKILISEGLAISTDPPGRRTLTQVDPIESMIVKGRWVEPKENSVLQLDTAEAKWFSVKANDEGWFRGRELRGSYIYYTYESDEDKIMILEGHNYYNVFVNQEPRIGNIYGNKEEYESWEPNFNISYLPVKMKKGKNEFLFQVSYGGMKAVLHEKKSDAFFNINDNTMPDVFKDQEYSDFGGIIVVNAQDITLKNAKIKVINKDGVETITDVSSIIPASIRKVRFDFKGKAGSENKEQLKVQLIVGNKVLDEKEIDLKCVNKLDAYRQTFISDIDGSVQYYAVKPSTSDADNQALFLSVHGARVEAFNQAGSYSNKEWGNIVAPTNRRPYGFNWEDIGRIDALEVLNIAKKKFNADENRIYLTGHSMGGHGTWYLGVNYPDQFAAIGPSAGWISLWSYRYREREEKFSDVQKMFTRAAKQSDTYTLAPNYSQLGIYIVHGDADSVVSPSQARSMIRTLKDFHKDYDYHFEPGKEHWWDVDTVKPGSDCVDWTPMFDFFSRHARPLNRIKKLNFKTASPGISSKNYWVTIEQQEKQFDFSEIEIEFVPEVNIFRTTVSNIKTFSVDLEYLGIKEGSNITLSVNGQNINGSVKGDKVFVSNKNGNWELSPNLNKDEKNPVRYGSFKDLFKNNLTLVYGTNGNEKENEAILAKVRYDSEMFWYVGNGAFEIIPDSEFDPEKYKDNNILLYGNSKQNSAFNNYFKNTPVDITSDKIKIEDKNLSGKNLASYLIYPKKGSEENLVGVIAGTGIEGLRLTYMRPFLKPGSAFPDVTVFNTDILEKRDTGISAAGIFGLDWSVKNGEFVIE